MQGIHYGTPQANSLHLVKHYFEKYPEDVSKVVLSIKGAYDMKTGPNGTPEGIRTSVEGAVKVLGGTKAIDVLNVRDATPTLPSRPRSRPWLNWSRRARLAASA